MSEPQNDKVLIVSFLGGIGFLHEGSLAFDYFEFSEDKTITNGVREAVSKGYMKWRETSRLSFVIYDSSFAIFEYNTLCFKRHLDSLMGGFCDKIHGNEGVRNYLLKLGIKEHES